MSLIPSALCLIENRHPLNRGVIGYQIGIAEMMNVLDEGLYFAKGYAFLLDLTKRFRLSQFVAREGFAQDID
jgi:hypothetical protein